MLKQVPSCEVQDLIKEVSKVSGKSYSNVEGAFFTCYLYPESKAVYISDSLDSDIEWLNDAVNSILKQNNIKSLYILEAY